VKRYLILFPAGLVACLGIAVVALAFKQPDQRSAPALTVERTEARIARGKYLYEQAAHCGGCHNDRDWKLFSAPTRAGRAGAGFVFPAELEFPGTISAPNITPDRETGIGGWTDGEIARAIREGVSRDGRALFPFMPYKAYRSMSDEDVYSVIAYLRTLPALRQPQPRTELNLPVNLLVKFEPKPLDHAVPAPDRSNSKAYGEYLVRIAGCIECHSPFDNGKVVEGKEFAGGHEFVINGFTVRSANITPDEETGIGKWSEDRFVAKFKGYASMTSANAPKHTQANFTLMPWIETASMPEQDLRSIYAYLRTLKPIYNSVEVHPPTQAALNHAR
jgi:mono/diheme cytochrome c family protein